MTQPPGREPRLRISRGRRMGDVRVVRRRRQRGLERVLGVPALFSAAYGNVGSSIYYALGVTALYALGMTPVVFVISGVFFLFTALTYAEGTAAMPEAGGSAVFARRAFGRGFSFLVGWAQILNYVVTIAISALAVPGYLSVFWPMLKSYPVNVIVAIAVTAALGVVNIIGTRESSRINISIAVIDLASQALVITIGLVIVFNPELLTANVDFGTAPTFSQFLLGIAISMIAYTGIETVSNLSEETRNVSRTVPRSIMLTFGTVVVIYTLIPMVALSAMPVVEVSPGVFETKLATDFLQNPVLGIVREFGLGGFAQDALERWVGLLAATILVLATNAGMLGLSRLAYSLGRNDMLPARVSQLHPTRRTPVNAIIVTVILTSLLILPGKVTVLASLYSFGAMLSFTFAHASIVRLRVTEPELERPFRIPWNWHIRGHRLPITALLGAAATSLAWLVVVVTQPTSWMIGVPWLGVGLAYYLWQRRRDRDRPAGVMSVRSR
ncbi:MAG: APC family permease [Dehalococcoidia bacterium]